MEEVPRRGGQAGSPQNWAGRVFRETIVTEFVLHICDYGIDFNMCDMQGVSKKLIVIFGMF